MYQEFMSATQINIYMQQSRLGGLESIREDEGGSTFDQAGDQVQVYDPNAGTPLYCTGDQ
jgi:hypothetical protein